MEKQIKVTDMFLLVLKIFLDQKKSESPEYLGYTEMYNFFRLMPAWKKSYGITHYSEDESSPVAIVAPEGKVYPRIVGENEENLLLCVNRGVLPPSEEDQKALKQCFPQFNIEWIEIK